MMIAMLSAGAETLHYTINWQSGLNLGEASVSATKHTASGVDSGWDFQLTLDAAVPGFTIRDDYKATSDAKFCSAVLDKAVTRGTRKSGEKVTFDQERKIVKRETNGGGKSEPGNARMMRSPSCNSPGKNWHKADSRPISRCI